MRLFGFDITRTKAAVSALGVRDVFGWVKESFPGAWQKGVVVDPIGSVMSFGAVFACVKRIADDISKLEPEVLVMQDDGTFKEAPNASPFWVPVVRPNHYQNRIQFLHSWVVSKLIFGNAYVLKARDARGVVVAWYVLDPRRVTPMVTPDGDVYYSIGGSDIARIGAGAMVPASEVIHDRGATLWHPLVGVSAIYACGAAATQGIRIQGNSAKFFENMSRPSGMLTSPGTIADETVIRLKTEWEQNYSKENIGRLAVLGDGMKYEPMTIPPQDAQLVQQLGWTVEDVARCFSMPLYKINAGPMPTSGNVEALELQYYSGCLQVLIESIELCMTEGLGLGSGSTAGYKVQICLDGLLRMDTASQVDMLSKAVGGAIMKPDEARAKLNMSPTDGGDQVYLQQQNYSLAALAKRDAKEDPFGTAKPPAAEPAHPAAPVAPDQGKHFADVAAAHSAANAEVVKSMGAIAREALAAADQARTDAAARIAAAEEQRAAELAAAELQFKVEREAADAKFAEFMAQTERAASAMAERLAAVEKASVPAVLDATEDDEICKALELLTERFRSAELIHA